MERASLYSQVSHGVKNMEVQVTEFEHTIMSYPFMTSVQKARVFEDTSAEMPNIFF